MSLKINQGFKLHPQGFLVDRFKITSISLRRKKHMIVDKRNKNVQKERTNVKMQKSKENV